MIFSLAIIDGTTMSAKPTTIVWLASAASGTCSSFRIGRKGIPSQVNIGVASDNTRASVPAAMITGVTPSHRLRTVSRPFFKNSLRFRFFSAFKTASWVAHSSLVKFSGTASSFGLSGSFNLTSLLWDKGGIRGTISAATIPEIPTIR